jgi:hypothetical protein
MTFNVYRMHDLYTYSCDAVTHQSQEARGDGMMLDPHPSQEAPDAALLPYILFRECK